MTEFQHSDSDPRPRSRYFLEKMGVGLLMLSLPGSMQPSAMDIDLPYDTPDLPPVSTTATPHETPKPKKTTQSTCRESVPIRFSWPDMGIKDVEVEKVGIDTEHNSIAAPTGKDSDGHYDTAGWYKYGPKPGASDGTPVFVMHRAPNTGSLLKKDFASTMRDIRDSGKSTEFTLEQDNGTKCTYEINKQTGIWPKLNKDRDYTPWFNKVYDNGPTDKKKTYGKALFITCAGDFNYAKGTSEDSTTMVGELVDE